MVKLVERLGSSVWSPIPGGITAPRGFQSSGIATGLKSSQKADLALLLLPEGSICSGKFTQSLVRAACVDLCIDRIHKRDGRVRAVLINSGQANAFTGDKGLTDSLRATDALARSLGLLNEEVLICSTGVIGQPIPMDKLLGGLDELLKGLSSVDGLAAAQAILTTDLVPKQFALQADLGGRIVRIGGMAKGSGMIHPNMATMLGFMSCDVGVSLNCWNEMIKRVVDSSFNVVTVDGDTSTNDSLLAFSSGEALENQFLDTLESGMTQLAQYLSKAIARDGEGATCLVQVRAEGLKTDTEARQVARTICSSSLVKSAINGCDPNWGRIVAAAGRAGVNFTTQFVALWIGPFQLIENGQPLNFDRSKVSLYIKNKMNSIYSSNDFVDIKIKFGSGEGNGLAWGCDLSEQYVRINADYTT